MHFSDSGHNLPRLSISSLFSCACIYNHRVKNEILKCCSSLTNQPGEPDSHHDLLKAVVKMQNEIPKCDGEESTASGDAWEGSTEGLRVPAHEVCVRSDSTQLSERTQSMQLHYSPKVRTAALRGTVPETYNGSSCVFCSKDVGNILGQLCKQKLLVGAIADRTDSDNFGNTLAVSRRYHEKENHKFPHTHKKKRPRQCITKTTSQLRMNGEKGLLLPNNKHPAQQVLCSTWVCHLCS